MKCPKCSLDNDKVLESRQNKLDNSTRRRRECLNCGFRFTSYERIEDRPITVLKKDGSRQSFDLSKIERGIISCTEKLVLDKKEIEKTLAKINNIIKQSVGANNTIKSIDIGEIALKEIYSLSPVAYVRFASVYKAFNDLDQFISEIESILK